MSKWICESCGLDFSDPFWRPEYVDDSGIPEHATPLCPFCMSEEIAEFIDDEDFEEEDE